MTDKTLGGYIRTTPHPDDMDGGVTAALIEKEVTDPDGDGLSITTQDGKVWITCTAERHEVTVGPIREDLLAEMIQDRDTEFWVRRWSEAATQRDARDVAALAWKEVARRLSKRVHGLGWERDQYRAGEEEAEGRADRWHTSWGVADRLLKNAEKRAALWKETARRAILREKALHAYADAARSEHGEAQTRADKAERERDEARGALRARLGVLAESRPLTPDAITDEMVKRAVYAFTESKSDQLGTAMRLALTAALTEPPTRPEGAEDIERLLTEDLGDFRPPVTPAAIADLLAARGVRAARRDEEKR